MFHNTKIYQITYSLDLRCNYMRNDPGMLKYFYVVDAFINVSCTYDFKGTILLSVHLQCIVLAKLKNSMHVPVTVILSSSY